MDWRENISEILSNPTYLFEISKTYNENGNSNDNYDSNFTLLQNWEYLVNSLISIQKYIKRIYALDKIHWIIYEKKKKEQELVVLKSKLKQLIEVSRSKYLQSRENLIKQRINEREKLQSEEKIAQDEVRAIEIQYNQYNKKKENYEILLKQLKNQQRELYLQTNEITKRMDELDPRIIVYQEKIGEMEDNDISPDQSRIKNKLSIIEKEYQKLLLERKRLMRSSRELQKRLNQERQTFKSINKKISHLKPILEEKSDDLRQILRKIQMIDSQINEISKETIKKSDNLKSFNNQSVNIEDNCSDFIKYSSVSEIQSIIEKIKLKIQEFDQILVKNLKISKFPDIEKVWNLKFDQFTQELHSWEDESKINNLLFKKHHDTRNQIEKLIDFKNWLNILIDPINISCNLDFSISDENTRIEISLLFFKASGESLNYKSDLTRYQKTILYLSCIFSFYLSNQIFLIPIRISGLDPTITSKQSFKKATEHFSNIFKELSSIKPVKIVIFLDTSMNYDIPTQIKI
ncbi:hypothetical protein [Candidatus Harpocratesius sp.]